MTPTKQLVLTATRAALRARQEAGVPLTDAVCAHDLAERLGVEVWFTDIPSLEAVYIRRPPPAILVTSLRPPGRRAYNCAHELGHHVFGHGAQLDLLPEEGRARRFDPKEFLADCFAGFLLMPKLTVCHGFAKRGWSPPLCSPEQAFVIAGWLGVGYETLLTHMSRSLGLIPGSRSEELSKMTPQDLRGIMAPGLSCNNLVVVDPYWTGRPVDLETGDIVVAPPGTAVEGTCAESLGEGEHGKFIRGCAQGKGRLVGRAGWNAFLRVSRAGFTGRARYRHLEEEQDE